MEELFEAKSDDLKKQLAENASQLPVPQDLTKDDWLLAKVLDAGNIEILERFLKAKHEEEDRQAKKLFDENFSAMQKEYKPVERTKEVWNKTHDKVLYKFCPLEDILKVYAPIISAHGFSYRWSEESINEGKDKRIYCIVSGYGHEERGYVDIPILAGNDFTNSVQQRGVSTSYGKRYSFINAFGIIIDDEDDDASTLDTIVGIADEIKKMKDCKSLADMQKVFTDSYHAIDGDKSLDAKTKQSRLDMLIATKDELKKSLK